MKKSELKIKNLKFKITAVLFLAACILLPASSQAAVPKLITYQGMLKNDSGTYLTGTYSMVFSIYTAESGGSSIWDETHSSVSVTSGRFSVELGSVDDVQNPLDLNFDTQYYLGIKVGTDAEMTPRIKMTSVGYALTSKDAETAMTQTQHSDMSHMGAEGVRANATSLAKTMFKLDTFTLASAYNMGDMIIDTFYDESGIDNGAGKSSGYQFLGSPDYKIILSPGGIDSDAKLMLHGDGTDASTTFTDDSDTGHSFTAYGNAQIDTAQSKFGGASMEFDGAGDYIEGPNSTEFDLGTGDFTIDAWIRVPSSTIYWRYIAKKGTGWAFYLDPSTGIMKLLGSSSTTVSVTSSSFDNDTWTHVAVVRSGSNIKFFRDGTQVGSDQTAATNYNGTSTGIRVGYGGGVNDWKGHIDELRISKGTARWTENFTPPAAPYSEPATTATIISKKYEESTVPGEVILCAEGEANTGTINYWVSRDDGTTWKSATNEQVVDLTNEPVDSDVRWKVQLTGDAELTAIAVAV